MTASPNQLVNELKGLRKGRGLHAPGLHQLIGPALRQLCGIGTDDGADVARERLQAWVVNTSKNLPEDLRVATLTALGLNPQAQQPFFADRAAWLADRERRDTRTIRRRVDIGLSRLAEAAARQAAPPGEQEDWHVRRFSALLRLEGSTPVCTEQREIVATGGAIDQISWSISLPRAGDNGPKTLDVQVLHGVVLKGTERPSPRRLLMHLGLPRRIEVGQAHTFSLEVRVPPGEIMQPTYVFWPERRCEQFDLIVRFDPDRAPAKVWRVAGVFHRDADDIEPGPDLLAPDAVGEVSVSFAEPKPGRGYGVQWLP